MSLVAFICTVASYLLFFLFNLDVLAFVIHYSLKNFAL